MSRANALPGEIVTFYSYKGGTGRSLMLANVAWILASAGRRVLTIDWDLEAPGLHRYFLPFIADRGLTRSDGIIDFAIEFATEAVSPARAGDEHDDQWFLPFADLRRFASALDYSFPREGGLHFVGAGRQGPSYPTRVNSFDWEAFYSRFGGSVFLETTRNLLRDHYDYVLIDSRTGVSDTSGICTVEMPDTLVTCFTLNNQGIEGAAAVTRSVLAQRPESSFRVLPVAMRVENSEKEKAEERKAYAREQFAGLPNDLKAAEHDEYWSDVAVPYVPFYAYEEVLATFADAPGERHSILAAAERITDHITKGLITRAKPPPDRERVLAAFGRRQPEGSSRATRFDIYVSYGEENEEAALELTDLLHSYAVTVWLSANMIKAGSRWHEEAATALRSSRMVVFLVGRRLSQAQHLELSVAAERAQGDPEFLLIPALLPGAEPSVLPEELRARQSLDMRAGSADPRVLGEILQLVSGRPSTAAPTPQRKTRPSPARKHGARDMMLYRRTDAIEHRLRFASASAEWLTDADPRTMTPVVRQLARQEWETRRDLDDLTRELLDEPFRSLEDAWERYERLELRSRELFDQVVDLVGAVAIRNQGLDERACIVADGLIAECARAFAGDPWTGLTVPPGSGDGQLSGRLLRLPFSDWAIWSLPLVVKEYALGALRDDPRLREISDRAEVGVTGNLSISGIDLAANALATMLMGPAYACAAILLALRGDSPNDHGRVYAILTTLRRSEETLGELIDELCLSWDNQMRPRVHLPGRDELEAATDVLVRDLHYELPPFGLYGASEQMTALRLTESWRSGLVERRPLPRVSEGDGLRDVLNAAWLSRLFDGEEHAGTLDAQVKDLCIEVIARDRDGRDPAPIRTLS